MSRLFLIAASGAAAREHLEISLAQGVPLNKLSRLEMILPDLQARAKGDVVFAWGATPGPMNLRRWEALEPGDVGLVYSQGSFPFCARVYAKARSAQTAQAVWGTDGDETWELMYVVDRPVPLDADLDDAREALGYADNWVPQGFSFLGEAAEHKLIEDFGGFDQFLASVSSSAGPVGAVAEPPEVEDAVEAVAAVAGAPRKGQGPQMSPAVRKAIEMHAMAQAAAHYADRGWGVKDVSARESYDLLCRKDGTDDLRVEVKGTTSAGHAVLLTRNEVANAKAQHPNVALVVVSHIRVDRTAVPPTASGGQLRVDDPWSLVETALEPLAFSYELPAH